MAKTAKAKSTSPTTSSNPAHALAAEVLGWHFGSEASHAGFRSSDLSGVGGGTLDPDRSMVARMAGDMGAQEKHRRIRAALREVGATHAEVLSLAYGVVLRDRDVDEDGAARRRKGATRSPAQRDWRVRLHDFYGFPEAAAVLASPIARRRYVEHVEALREQATTQKSSNLAERVVHVEQAGIIGWLLTDGRPFASAIRSDALRAVREALDAFVAAYQPPSGPRLDAIPKPRRTRDMAKTRARILAFHAEHGQEIG